jgi:hypothetical protein
LASKEAILCWKITTSIFCFG